MVEKGKVYVSEVQGELKELDILSKQANKLADALKALQESKDKEKEEIVKDLNVASDCLVLPTLYKIKLKLDIIHTSLEKQLGDSKIDNPGYIW